MGAGDRLLTMAGPGLVMASVRCSIAHTVTRCTQARARLRELHADILARQLAAAEAGTDVRAEMGWDREEREVQRPENAPCSEYCEHTCGVRCYMWQAVQA
jgi:hypothetical protein